MNVDQSKSFGYTQHFDVFSSEEIYSQTQRLLKFNECKFCLKDKHTKFLICIYTHTHTYKYIHTHIYMLVCMKIYRLNMQNYASIISHPIKINLFNDINK